MKDWHKENIPHKRTIVVFDEPICIESMTINRPDDCESCTSDPIRVCHKCENYAEACMSYSCDCPKIEEAKSDY